MTSQGSAITGFERAVEVGNPNLVVWAARELPQPMQIRHMLKVVLVLAAARDARFSRAAVRFGARLMSDLRLSIAEAPLAFAALPMLAESDPAAGVEALCELLERHHEPDAAHHLDSWRRRRESTSPDGGS